MSEPDLYRFSTLLGTSFDYDWLTSTQVKDILECRIELLLVEVGAMTLCELPDEDPITMEEFTAATDRSCRHAAESLTRYFHSSLQLSSHLQFIPFFCYLVFELLVAHGHI